MCSNRWSELYELAFVLFFAHPYFSGFERIYDFFIRRGLLRWETEIASFFKRMHDAHWKAATVCIQYVMHFLNSCTLQISEIVVSFLSLHA